MTVSVKLFSRQWAKEAVQKHGEGTRLRDDNTYGNEWVNLSQRLQLEHRKNDYLATLALANEVKLDFKFHRFDIEIGQWHKNDTHDQLKENGTAHRISRQVKDAEIWRLINLLTNSKKNKREWGLSETQTTKIWIKKPKILSFSIIFQKLILLFSSVVKIDSLNERAFDFHSSLNQGIFIESALHIRKNWAKM